MCRLRFNGPEFKIDVRGVNVVYNHFFLMRG